MYLINWNEHDNRIEANFGGCITVAEVEVFLEDLLAYLTPLAGQTFDVVIDYATVRRLEAHAERRLAEAREMSAFAGASKVTFVARDEEEAVRLTDLRLQQVLEGRELYVAFALAA